METTQLLDKIFQPFGDVMTPEMAEHVVELQAPDEVQRRINELGSKCNEGALTEEERDEYDTIIRAIDFISIVQSKARQVLQRNGS